MEQVKRLRPQEGPQMQFLSSPADIVIYGGAAGGGKTWGMLMDPLRHIHNPNFGAVYFRRNTTQIKNEGGLWDESMGLYLPLGAAPREHTMDWRFPSGANVGFAHLEYDKTVANYQGSQIPAIYFDELTHFTEKQFFYMLSRNRSMCGVRPYVRATCNPDADSWVARFIAWWIDCETGLAIPERSGVIRYFVRVGDAIHWASRPQDLAEYRMPDEHGNMVPIPPKSVTFISAKLTDNKALLRSNPDYMANLMALSRVDRERLLGGNWKIRPAAGLYFQREWVTIVDAVPAGLRTVRGWDLAATVPTAENPDPDFTEGCRMGTDGERYFITDHKAARLGPKGVRTLIKATAAADGYEVGIRLPQDPGQAGKDQASEYTTMLAGYDVRCATVTGDKLTRFGGFSAQAEAGNVYVLRGAWNERLFTELENFPPGNGGHDDAPDAVSEAFNALARPRASTTTTTAKGRH